MRSFLIIVSSSLFVLAATSCSKSDKASNEHPNPTAPAETPAATPPAPLPVPTASTSAATPAKAKVELEIASVGDTMFFDKKVLTVPAGAEVHLTLKNNSKLPVMTHNWVLVKAGTEAAVALAGLEHAPDAGYVVPSPDVLAYTALAAPGQTVDVTFTAPPPGDYPYICTFPGHYLSMKGVLEVKP